MIGFNVAQFLQEPIGTSRSYRFEEEVFRVDDLEVQNLHGHTRMTRLRGEILVQGQVEGEVSLECSRCLEPYIQQVCVDLEVEFFPSPIDLEQDPSQDLEQDGIFFIDEHHILDLDEAIREAFILNLPMQPLCKMDCAGICPICGENLNTGNCPGHAKQVDERMAVLAKLLSPEEPLE